MNTGLNISDALRAEYIKALKNKNPDSKIYGYYLSCAQKVEKDGGGEAEIISGLQKEYKILGDNLSYARTKDEVDSINLERKILQKFLPVQMDVDEIRSTITSILGEMGISIPFDVKDKGRIMKILMPKVKGHADGKLVNRILQEYMSH